MVLISLARVMLFRAKMVRMCLKIIKIVLISLARVMLFRLLNLDYDSRT